MRRDRPYAPLGVRSKRRAVLLVILGLTASIVLHGTYDFLVILGIVDARLAWTRFAPMPVLVGLYVAFERALEQANMARAAVAPPAASRG